MTVSEQIIQVLDDLCRKFGIVIDWTKESVLPYIEELAEKFIAYEVKTSWFFIFLTLAISVVVTIIGIVLWKASEDLSPFIILLVITLLLLFTIAGLQIYDIITCETFPEKILLREIKELLDSSGY